MKSDIKHATVLKSGNGIDEEVTQTRVLLQEQWQHVLVQTHCEPAEVVPVIVKQVPEPQIILLKTGSMRIKLNSNGKEISYLTNPGQLFLTSEETDAYRLQWKSTNHEPIQTIHLYLSNELMRKTAAAASGADPVKVKLKDGSCINDPILTELGYLLANELVHPEASGEIYAETAAEMIAVHLLRHHCTVTHNVQEYRGKLPAFRLQQINEYISAGMQNPITLHDLSSIACMSPYHFCRVFKHTTGMSPNQYVIRHRIKRAKQLLLSGYGVEQTAAAVGYQSANHFSRLFERITGHLPGIYRRIRM